MTLFLAIAAVGLVGCISGCGSESDAPEPDETRAVKVEVAQVFSPKLPYGEEGSAAFVQFEQDGEPIAAVGPVPSRATDNQGLGEVELHPGTYDVRAAQLICGPEACEDALPIARNLDRQELACDGELKAGDPPVADVVVFVDPDKVRCHIETGFVERG